MKAPSVPTRAVVAGLVALTLVSSSCGDPLLAPGASRPGPASSESLLGDDGLLASTLSAIKNLTLLECKALPAASATQTVGSSGGTINVGPHSLAIPPGALNGNVTITAYAPSVPRREVQFSPEGLKFSKAATLTMSYEKCSLAAQLLPKKVVYVDDDLNILELLLSTDLPLSQKVTGRLRHFSGYAVSY